MQKLELLQQRVRMVKQLFRDKSQTEFIIATIPTYLGVNESSRWDIEVRGTECSHYLTPLPTLLALIILDPVRVCAGVCSVPSVDPLCV